MSRGDVAGAQLVGGFTFRQPKVKCATCGNSASVARDTDNGPVCPKCDTDWSGRTDDPTRVGRNVHTTAYLNTLPATDEPGVSRAPLAPRRRITGEERETLAFAIHVRYQGGATIRQIAHDLDRSYGFVNNLLREAETTFRPRGGDTRRPRR